MAAADFNEFVTLSPRFQYGSGFYFRGSPRPRIGGGIGSFLLNFFRPVLRKALPAALDVVSKVASDAVQGQSVKDSFKKHAAAKVVDVLGDAGQSQPAQVSISSPAVAVSKGKRVASARRRPVVVKVKRKKTGVLGSGVSASRKRARVHSSKRARRSNCESFEEGGQYPALRFM